MTLIGQFPTIETGDPELDRFGSIEYLTERDVLQEFLELAVLRTGSEIGYLHRYDEATEDLALTVWSSAVFRECNTIHENHYPLVDAGIWADSIRHGQTVIHNEYAAIADAKGLPDGHFAVYSHMSATARAMGKVVAVLGVGNKRPGYDDKDRLALETFLELGWPQVENRVAEYQHRTQAERDRFAAQDINDILYGLLQAVGRAVELRDRYTSRHQSNVAYMCDAIGVRLGMSDHERLGLRIGASIHDIGKLSIPADILNAPRVLTPPEMALMRTHAVAGATLFSTVPVPWPLAKMIRQHHERMDGSGYPDGLTGLSICLEARIIGVADSFDSVASHRPYHSAKGKVAAMAELAKGRATLYDPYVVDALEDALKTDPLLSGHSMYID